MASIWRTTLVLLFILYTPVRISAAPKITRGEAKSKSHKNCFTLLTATSKSDHLPIAPSLKGKPDTNVENHTLRADEWVVGDFIVKQKQMVQGDGTLPTSLLRDGNFLELSYAVPEGLPAVVGSRPSTRLQNEKINEAALRALDESRNSVAQMAVELESKRRKFPESVIRGLKEAAPRHWDATIFEFKDKTTNQMVGSMRIDSSGPDRRILAYPEIIKNFLTGKYKGKWIKKKVDPSITKPLILEEILSKEVGKPVEVERPVLVLDEPLILPNGEVLTEIVGEAKEIGALSVRKDVNAEVFNLLTQQMLLSLFNPNYCKEYNEHGQIFYAWGEEVGIRLWSNGMGFEQLHAEAPFNLSGQDWWIMRHTPQTLAKWIDGIAKKPTTSKEEEDRLRYIFEGLRGTELTDEYRQIWNLYYVQGKTQPEIAKLLKTSPAKISAVLKSSNAKLNMKVEFPYYDQETFRNEAQNELFEEASNYGIRRVSGNYGTKRIALKLASLLPEAPEKEALIEELGQESWGWTEYAGLDAAQGRGYSSRTLYFALYRIARVLKNTSRGKSLDLTKLHETGGFHKFLSALDPNRLPFLRDKEQKAAFMNPDVGTYRLYRTVAQMFGYTAMNLGANSKNFALKILSSPRIPESEAKKNLANDIENRQWPKTIQSLNQEAPTASRSNQHKESFQEVYRSLYGIASLCKASPGGSDINPEKIWEPTELEKLFKYLYPELKEVDLLPAITEKQSDKKRVSPKRLAKDDPEAAQTLYGGIKILPLNETNQKTFLDPEKGSLMELQAIAKSLGIKQFHKFGIQNLMIKLLNMGQSESELRGKIIKAVSDAETWGWKETDWSGVNQGIQSAVARTYRALVAVATVVKERELTQKEIDKLCTVDGVNELVREIQRQHSSSSERIPIAGPLVPKKLKEFENGGRQVLVAVAREMGKPFVKPYGMRDLVFKLAEYLPESKTKTEVKRVLQSWTWSSSDGQHAFDLEGEGIRQKLFQATHLIATALNKLGNAQVDLPMLHTADEMERFTNLLILGANLPSLTDAHKTILLDSEKGSFGELQMLAKSLGVNKYTSHYGIQNLLVDILNRSTTPSDFREKIIKAISNDEVWGWKENDVANVREGSEPAINRLYRGLIATAMVVRGRELTTKETVRLCTAVGINELVREVQNQQEKAGKASALTLIPTYDQLSPKKLEEFEQGGQQVLASLARLSGKGKMFTSDFGMRDFVYKLADQLPEGQDKESTITTLKSWEWKAKDGRDLTVDARQRLFLAAQLIATSLKKSGKAEELELENLLTASEMQKFTDYLIVGANIPPLTDANKKLFKDPKKGSFKELSLIAASVGADNLFEKDGIQKLMVKLLNRSQTPSDFREKVIGAISDKNIWGWIERDYAGVRVGMDTAINRTYRAIVATAMVARGREMTPEEATRLCTAEGIQELVREIQSQGYDLTENFVPLERMKEFREGGQKVLLDLSHQIGVPLNVQDGLRSFLYKLAELIPDKDARTEVLGTFKKMEWNRSDGPQIYATSLKQAPRKLFQGIRLIASALNKSGQAQLDLQKLHTESEMEKLTDLLTLGVSIPALSQSDHNQFMDLKNGGLRELGEFGRSLGGKTFKGQTFRNDFGIPTLLKPILQRYRTNSTFSKKLADAVLDPVRWGWAKYDADKAYKGFMPAVIRAYRGIIATAMAVRGRELTPNEITRLCTADGIRELMQKIPSK